MGNFFLRAGQDLPELGEASAQTSKKLEAAVQQLEAKLQTRPKDKPLKKAVQSIRKDMQVGWLSLAHNLLKKAAIDQKPGKAIQG